MAIKKPQLVTRADFTAVAVADLIYQLRAEVEDYPSGSPQYNVLVALIMQATEWVESYTGQTLVDSTYAVHLDAFPVCNIELPFFPVSELVSVVYTDSASVEQAIAVVDIDADLYALRPQLRMTNGWPVARGTFNAITVTVKAGYATADAIPHSLKSAVLMLATHLHENASATTVVKLEHVPFGVRAMADANKVSWL